MRLAARTAAAVAVLALSPACSQTSGPAPEPAAGVPRILLAASPSGQRTIDVAGLAAEDLAHLERATLSRDAWQAILRVRVAQADPAPVELPAVLGDHAVRDGVLRFTPQFPFDAGQRYEVVFDPSSLPSARGSSAPTPPRALRAMVEVPAPDREPSTRVVAVYPTGPEVPENHLRLYVVFSAPMGLAAGSAHVRLLDEHGRPAADPFLPLDVDLWNADRTRFTVLYDPGRVKRGIRPNAELGRPLETDRAYTLEIDAAWRDAAGQPLVAPFRREFRVGPARERALDPTTWQLDLPGGGTRDPLAVRFPVPLDYGLLQRTLRVATGDGRPLAGEIRVEQGETRWTFTPHAPWRPGEYRLVAAATLEDVAGNRIGRPFEVDAEEPQDSERTRGAVVPFRIVGVSANQPYSAATAAQRPRAHRRATAAERRTVLMSRCSQGIVRLDVSDATAERNSVRATLVGVASTAGTGVAHRGAARPAAAKASFTASRNSSDSNSDKSPSVSGSGPLNPFPLSWTFVTRPL